MYGRTERNCEIRDIVPDPKFLCLGESDRYGSG